MTSCRICHTNLSDGETARGTCDKCEEELAKKILHKIITNQTELEKEKTRTL